MNKEKIGLIIFAISAIFMIVLGWLSSWWITAALRDLTLAQINETIWATDGALFLLWSLSVPFSGIICRCGHIAVYGVERLTHLVVRNRSISHNTGGPIAANAHSLSSNLRYRRRFDIGIFLRHTLVLGKEAYNT